MIFTAPRLSIGAARTSTRVSRRAGKIRRLFFGGCMKPKIGRPRSSVLVAVTFRLDPETIAAIDALAKSAGVSKAAAVRDAVMRAAQL